MGVNTDKSQESDEEYFGCEWLEERLFVFTNDPCEENFVFSTIWDFVALTHL